MKRFNAAERALIDLWEAHTAAEFEHKDADAAIATMTEHPVDQATVLLQLGVLEGDLPVLGADQADRLLNPDALANTLIKKVL